MKHMLLIAFSLFTILTNAQNPNKMKLNAGIITENFQETKAFYTEILGFGITFENEFYVLMHTPNDSAEISFLKPNHPSQQPIFQQAFEGRGVYFTIEVDNLDEVYKQLKNKNVEFEVEVRDEDWGDRHFVIMDPNGIGIDIVTYTAPGN